MIETMVDPINLCVVIDNKVTSQHPYPILNRASYTSLAHNRVLNLNDMKKLVDPMLAK